MFWYSSSRGGETQRRRVPRTKNFFICGGYNLSAVLCLKTTQFAYNSTYYQQAFWSSYGLSRLCCHCPYGNGRRGTKGFSHLRIVNKGRNFSCKYFLDFEEKYGKISDYRTFNYFKFSHFIAGTSATFSLRYNFYLLLCMDNNLDHSFERKLLSTGRKLRLALGPI